MLRSLRLIGIVTRGDHRRLAISVAIAIALMGAGLLASPGSVLGWDSGTFNSSSERELVTLTNQARAAAGLRALKVDSALTSIRCGRLRGPRWP